MPDLAPTSSYAETGSAAAAAPDPLAATSSAPKPLSTESILLLVLLALVWGSSFILMKRGLTYFSYQEVAAIRMTSAGLFMVPIALARYKYIKRKHLPYMFISGFIGSFFPAFLFTAAGQHIDSGISGSLNGLSPLFTLLVGLWFFNARTPWQGYAGILVGLAGALALSLVRAHSGAELNVWSLLIVVATFMYGINLNVIKHHLADVHPITITAGALVPVGLVGLGVLALGTPFFGRVSDPAFWGLPLAASLTLGIFGSALSIIVYNRVIKNTSPLMASTVTYLMPVVALGWGLWDGEQIQGWQIIGLVLVLAGMGLVGWASRVKLRIEN